nr:hypothetical protein Q903MT_gene2728 [Picea sitchensis]
MHSHSEGRLAAFSLLLEITIYWRLLFITGRSVLTPRARAQFLLLSGHPPLLQNRFLIAAIPQK